MVKEDGSELCIGKLRAKRELAVWRLGVEVGAIRAPR